jgi:hypothetical protein
VQQKNKKLIEKVRGMGIEPMAQSVLRTCDNQLHQPRLIGELAPTKSDIIIKLRKRYNLTSLSRVCLAAVLSLQNPA